MSYFMYLNNDASSGNCGKPVALELIPFCDSQKNGYGVDDDTGIAFETQ